MEDSKSMDGPDSWPEPVLIYEHQAKVVKLTGLPKSLKGKAWHEIKTNSPALATILQDQCLKDIVAFFDADIFVEAKLVPCLPPEPLRGRNR